MKRKLTQNSYGAVVKYFLAFVLVLLNFFPAGQAMAEGASFYLSPSSGTFFVGSTFDVSIFVNTGGADANAVEVNLKFDPKKIQVANPTAGKSFIEVWVSQPAYSNTEGTMRFIGGVPSPGINTSSGLVSTVTFRAVTPGETSIVFSGNSKILQNDSKGTNILNSMGRGVYTLTIPPPEGPNVFSLTHPDQNKWYKNNNPTFSWEKEEKVTDFSYGFNEDPAGSPDNVSEGDQTSVSFSDVKDGIWYFHVKAKKDGIWGGASHYIVKIDGTSPAVFTPKIDPPSKIFEQQQPLVSFITTDFLSGMDYYQIKYIDITPERGAASEGFFVETASPYKLPSLGMGKYLIVVRAYDKAGNFREGTVKIDVLPKNFLITKSGIRWRDINIPWWILILILIILLILLLIIAFRKHRKTTEYRRQRLLKAEKDLEEQRKKLNLSPK